VLAAGGVVMRDGEVLLVHRPRYDDWTLPKGKLLPDESATDGALREVEEETGLTCELGEEVAASRYTDARGRPKLVRFWLMRPVGGSFTPTDEVDELRWLPLEAADALLSYDRDREVLDAVAERRRGTRPPSG